jgi:hypothetical protein
VLGLTRSPRRLGSFIWAWMNDWKIRTRKLGFGHVEWKRNRGGAPLVGSLCVISFFVFFAFPGVYDTFVLKWDGVHGLRMAILFGFFSFQRDLDCVGNICVYVFDGWMDVVRVLSFSWQNLCKQRRKIANMTRFCSLRCTSGVFACFSFLRHPNASPLPSFRTGERGRGEKTINSIEQAVQEQRRAKRIRPVSHWWG